jgi:hypothetical protein
MTFHSASKKATTDSALLVSDMSTSGTKMELRREELGQEQAHTALTAGMIMETLTLEVKTDAFTSGPTEALPRRSPHIKALSALSDTVKDNYSQELPMESKSGLLVVYLMSDLLGMTLILHRSEVLISKMDVF